MARKPTDVTASHPPETLQHL